MMIKIFLDANVFMEIMFARSKVDRVSEMLHNPENEYFISTLTVHILYYFAESEGISRSFVHRLVDLATHLPIDARMIEEAQRRYTDKDFEDYLQGVCAERGMCDEIITLDKRFKKESGTNLPVHVIR